MVKVKVEVKAIRSHGLETWQIWVAGKYHTEFLSEEKANSHAARMVASLGGGKNESKE